MIITIPGRDSVEISNLVLDFNGTIAEDGKLIKAVKEKIIQLSDHITVHVLTADTNGSVLAQCQGLPVTVHVIGKESQHLEKKNYLLQLPSKGVVSIGNGSNDVEMLAISDIAIAVIGSEGCATSSLMKSDLVVTNIVDALDLLLKQHRLVATLRI